MFASPCSGLITVRPAHSKFNNVSQLLLDLQQLVLVTVPGPASLSSQKVLALAAPPGTSRPSVGNRLQRAPLSSANHVVAAPSHATGTFNYPRFLCLVSFSGWKFG